MHTEFTTFRAFYQILSTNYCAPRFYIRCFIHLVHSYIAPERTFSACVRRIYASPHFHTFLSPFRARSRGFECGTRCEPVARSRAASRRDGQTHRLKFMAHTVVDNVSPIFSHHTVIYKPGAFGAGATFTARRGAMENY